MSEKPFGLSRDGFLYHALSPLYEFYLNAVAGSSGMERTVNGTALRVLPAERRFFPPDYDAPVAVFIKARIKPGQTCINVGANIGTYVLQFANWTAPTGRIIAFEPNQGASRKLKKHVEINGFKDRVTIVEAAVSNAPGKAEFFACDSDGMSRLGQPNPQLKDKAVSRQVDVVTLDDYFEQHPTKPDWLLIDTEGYEIQVLEGARKTLEAGRGALTILVEMHSDAWASTGRKRADLEALLAELRMEAIPITGQRDPLKDYGIVALIYK